MAGFNTNTNMMDTTGVDIPAVQQALDSSSNSVVTLCTDSQRIQRMSRRKPIATSVAQYATTSALDTALASANYGFTIPASSSANTPSVLINSSGTFAAKNWTWTLPGGNHGKRLGDFRGYYKFPQDPVIACTYSDSVIVVDNIRDDGNFIVPFYIYQKSGKLQQRNPDVDDGMGSASSAQNKSDNQLRGSLAFDALDSEGALKPNSTIGNIYSPNLSTQSATYRPYFGLAIFQSDRTFVDFLPCAKKTTSGNTETWVPVPIQIVPTDGTYDIEMYQLSSDLIKISGLAGQYKAVPCVAIATGLTNITPASTGTGHVFAGDPEQGVTGGNDQSSATKYYMCIPPYQDTTFTFRNLFELNVGGANLYPYEVKGIFHYGESGPASAHPYQTYVSSTATDVYIRIRFYNESGKLLDIVQASSTYWYLNVKVSGSWKETRTSSSTSVSRTNGAQYYKGGAFQITAGSTGNYVDLDFEAGIIWYNSGGIIPPGTIYSGEVSMLFNGDTTNSYAYHKRSFNASENVFPLKNSGVARALTVTYQAP